jgi:hypothetical protein
MFGLLKKKPKPRPAGNSRDEKCKEIIDTIINNVDHRYLNIVVAYVDRELRKFEKDDGLASIHCSVLKSMLGKNNISEYVNIGDGFKISAIDGIRLPENSPIRHRKSISSTAAVKSRVSSISSLKSNEAVKSRRSTKSIPREYFVSESILGDQRPRTKSSSFADKKTYSERRSST